MCDHAARLSAASPLRRYIAAGQVTETIADDASAEFVLSVVFVQITHFGQSE
jgi:hypothetical protein